MTIISYFNTQTKHTETIKFQNKFKIADSTNAALFGATKHEFPISKMAENIKEQEFVVKVWLFRGFEVVDHERKISNYNLPHRPYTSGFKISKIFRICLDL